MNAALLLCKKWPFVTYGLLCLLALLLIDVFNLQYDGSGFETYFILSSAIWAAPFYIINETINWGRLIISIPVQQVIVSFSGLALLFAFDKVRHLIKRKKGNVGA